MAIPRIQVYVDESIHANLDFIVCAFVFSKAGLDEPVMEALKAAGLQPGIDEFKSGTHMQNNPAQQSLREALLGIAGQHTRIALAVSPALSRASLGEWCLSALRAIVRRNGFHGMHFDVHFDEGIVASTTGSVVAELKELCDVAIYSKQDSRACFGIQVADLVANATGQMIREAVTGRQKMVGIGGPETGYADDDQAPLGWSLKMALRYSMLRRPIAHPDQSFHPDTNPVVVERGADYVDIAQNPDVLGWGVQLDDALVPRVRAGVEQEFGKIWLGCIH